MKSQNADTWSEVAPGATWPGQRTISGTRMPPSYSMVFRPRNPAVLSKKSESVPPLKVGPLSLVNITTVFSATPSSSSVRRMAPIPSSMRVIMPA